MKKVLSQILEYLYTKMLAEEWNNIFQKSSEFGNIDLDLIELV